MKKEVLGFSRYLFDNYGKFRLPDFARRDFSPEILSSVISKYFMAKKSGARSRIDLYN
jgi:hypothetical protein